MHLTKEQARRYILLKQGLLGAYQFEGKKGVYEFVEQAGCIQFDPIDVCGKNAELVLQSRIESFSKKMLTELLYEDRVLCDYFDKNLSIVLTKDWPCFERTRQKYRAKSRGSEAVEEVEARIINQIETEGPICSKDLDLHNKIDWYWNATKLSRAALETLYFRGDLVVHHKKGTQKCYDLSKNQLPEVLLNTPDPLDNLLAYHKWHLCRRISAVGMMWNKASDAWLGIMDFKAKERCLAFESLLLEGKIEAIMVEGIKEPLYILSSDLVLIDEIRQKEAHGVNWAPRLEFIAPLDSLLWDRKLIKALFDIDYKWEIYTPESDRKYGYYVLPVLYGDLFVGRIEVVCNRKKSIMNVKNIWYEKNAKNPTEAEFLACVERFARFNEMEKIQWESFVRHNQGRQLNQEGG